MRWYSKRWSNGDLKLRKSFLWLPRRFGDEIRWLESYYSVLKYDARWVHGEYYVEWCIYKDDIDPEDWPYIQEEYKVANIV